MAVTWKYIVAEPLRTQLLTEYGVPERVIGLGGAEPLDEVFRDHCQPPHRSTDEQTAEDDFVVGICETNEDEALACRQRGGLVEYVAFDVDRPASIMVIADSTQGFLGRLFFELVELEVDKQGPDPRQTLASAAEAVGFEHLDATYEYVLAERGRGLLGWQRRLLDFCNSLE